MATRTFTLTHPAAPKSLNEGGTGSRRHWAVGYREKKMWHEVYCGLLLDEKVPFGMEFCHVDAAIRWKRVPSWGDKQDRRDVPNYESAITKPLADTLVQGFAGRAWLPDDTPAFFHFGELVFEVRDEWPHRDPRVKAELEVRLTARYPDSPEGPLVARGGRGAR